MNRRDFLKALAISPIVLMAKEKLPFKPNKAQLDIYGNPDMLFIKTIKFGEPFEGKVLNWTTFNDNLFLATDQGAYKVI